jgi:hypothetical protein
VRLTVVLLGAPLIARRARLGAGEARPDTGSG